MSDHNNLHKELDLIQDVIKRMADNSFKLKGWFIAVFSIVLAISSDKILPNNALLYGICILIPLVSFWYLDAYFLQQERLYRKLYDWVLANRSSTLEHQYKLNPQIRFKTSSIYEIMFSKTLINFYLFPVTGASLFLLFKITW